jgi:uncharacterized protein (DUF2147 family)
MLRVIFMQVVFLISGPSFAQVSPVGLWQSIDDETGKPRAEIRISEISGVLTGRIERSLTPITSDTPVLCALCTDDRKDKPLIGMEIIRQMRPGNDLRTWEGGEIMDPDKGKVFRLRLQLQDDGKKMQVRGYIGPFYRNQTWIRLPS